MPSIAPPRGVAGQGGAAEARHRLVWRTSVLLLAALLLPASSAPGLPGAPDLTAQAPAATDPEPDDPLATLEALLLEEHPLLAAARSRSAAARAGIEPAGTLPDPVVGLGLMSLPLPDLDPSMEGMTMLAFEVMQELPPRGLRGVRTEAARARARTEEARVEVLAWDLRVRLAEAWFELLLVSEAMEVHHRTHASLEAFARAAEAAYTEGVAPQADMLQAQTELASIEEHMAELRQRRGVALAEVNTLVGQDVREAVEVSFPARLVALVEGDPGEGMLSMHLSHAELGAGFPTLAELEALALEHRPELAVQELAAEAEAGELEAWRIQRRPGVRLSGSYGMRSGRSDMLSVGVSVPLPVFRSRKQDREVDGAEARLDAVRSDGDDLRRTIRREVAEAHADLLEVREQLVLLEGGVIPQARAAVESAAAAYRAGDGSFTALMNAQTILFRNEIQHAHTTAELGSMLARLERAVGHRIEPETSP